MATHETIRE